MHLWACELWSKFPWYSQEIYSVEPRDYSSHQKIGTKFPTFFLQIAIQLLVPKDKYIPYVLNHICITLLLSLSSTGALDPTRYLWNWVPMCRNTLALMGVTQCRYPNWDALLSAPELALSLAVIQVLFPLSGNSDPADPGSTPAAQPQTMRSAVCAMPCVLLSMPAVVLGTVCSREWDAFPPSYAIFFQHYPNGPCVAQHWILPLCFVMLQINTLSVMLQ